MRRGLQSVQKRFRIHGEWFAEARAALDLDLHDQVVSLAERMISEGRRVLRDFYDALERGEVEAVRAAAGPGVRAWREAAGVSQREVAAYIGVDPGNLSRFGRALEDPPNSGAPALDTALRMSMSVLLVADPEALAGGAETEAESEKGELTLSKLRPTAARLRAAAAKLSVSSGELRDMIVAELDQGDVGLPEQRLILALLRQPRSAAALLAHLQSDELEALRQSLRGPSLEHLFEEL